MGRLSLVGPSKQLSGPTDVWVPCSEQYKTDQGGLIVLCHVVLVPTSASSNTLGGSTVRMVLTLV